MGERCSCLSTSGIQDTYLSASVGDFSLSFFALDYLFFFTLVTLVEMGEVFRVVYLFEAATWSYKKGS